MSRSWDPILLPPGYAYGFAGGPAHDTRIHRLDGGGEQRVQVREEPIWRWSALRRNFRDGADVDGLRDFFLARRGALYGFQFLDPSDYSTNPNDHTGAPTALDQIIGYGDGVTRRFQLRKQYRDPGGMTARDFPRRVVPLLGTASAPVARALGIDTGDDLSPSVAVDGVIDTSAMFLPQALEVSLTTAPAIGEQVTWGGYFVVPARFSEVTDQNFEATITGFGADEASFEIESIALDDPVPLVPGGSPFGWVEDPAQTENFEVSGMTAFLHEVECQALISAFIDDLSNYPTGGPHLRIQNTGTQTLTVRDVLGVNIGTIASGGHAHLFVKEDAAGNRQPWLL